MPFQDIEDTAVVEAPRPPSVVERWLRKIFVEDLGLKLLALGITLALWFAVAGQNDPVTFRTNVQLNFIRPESLEIGNDPPKSVDVTLAGSRNDLDQINSINLFATVDVSDQKPGERVVRLLDRAKIKLPDGVKVESFEPTTIHIRLESRVEQTRPVDVKIEGIPAPGYEVYGINAAQKNIRIRGPASAVAAVKNAPTETVSIDGRKDSLMAKQVAIDIADPKIDLLDPFVDVAVEIGEKRAEKSFAGVVAKTSNGEMVQPGTANVTLSAPASVIAQLHPEDVKVVVEIATNGESVARLDLPASFKDRVKLISIKPSQFSISR